MNLRDENRLSVMQYLGYDPGTLRLATNCELRAYGRLIMRTVTICRRIPFKNTIYKEVCSNSNVFRQYYPEVFCDHHDIVYSLGECPVFERLDFKPDKIYLFTSL